MDTRTGPRRLLTAELLSIGSELTAGETRDTNAGELARALTGHGVTVLRATALPDRLDVVRAAFLDGLRRADIVVSTGGLGPTPDDLTREAIAAACGEDVTVDPELESWLRALWARRGVPFPELNLKQAWRIPSADVLPNPNGTAPGWFVRRADGRVIVALPGPPREMAPMWAEEARPRLEAIGLGTDLAIQTFRLTGIGESQVADLLGEARLRGADPEVATYARAEAVDVRISAMGPGAITPEARVAAMAAEVRAILGSYIWATGETTWSGAIGEKLTQLGWSLGTVELGMAGRFAALLGDVPWHRAADARTAGPGDLLAQARRIRQVGGTDVGLAIRATPRKGDTAVSVGIVTPAGTHQERRLAFLDGPTGRTRAALAAAAVLWRVLADASQGPPAAGRAAGRGGRHPDPRRH